ncbi:MAG TPA: hypothetical protein VHA06_09130 [Candidatus Angelobacter sp.]|nr:hypothetical protein [Candidatus Angelobacter sp.]
MSRHPCRQMKDDLTNDPLHKMLQKWQVATPLPPRFQERVWQGIAQAEVRDKTTLWMLMQSWLQARMPRRAMGAAYLVFLLAVGLAGHWQGQQQRAHLEGRLSQQYVQSIDPYQMPRR